MRKIDDNELIQLLKDGNMTQKQIAQEIFGCSEAAISKRKKKYERQGLLKIPGSTPDSFNNLTEREKKFVIARLEGKNQTQAAFDACSCGTIGSARSIGSQLSKKNDIKVVISELMQERGLTRTLRIDKLKEHLENKDPSTSLKSIEIANKMEGLYGTDKHLHLHPTREDYENNVRKMADLDKEMAELRAELGEITEAEWEEADR